MTATADGNLRLDDLDLIVGARTRSADFAESLASKGKIRYAAEFTEVELGATRLQGTPCAAVTLRFEGPTLARIDIMLPLAGDEKGWANWTMEGEMSRKASHEAWARHVFGRELEPKQIEGIIPFEVGADYPRFAAFPWGEVVSYYDSKGGFAYLCVRYQ